MLDQVFAELREGEYDMVVTGSSQARGALRHYIMGDLTRGIVNRANCPVRVARPGKGMGGGGIWTSLKRAFSSTPNDTPLANRQPGGRFVRNLPSLVRFFA